MELSREASERIYPVGTIIAPDREDRQRRVSDCLSKLSVDVSELTDDPSAGYAVELRERLIALGCTFQALRKHP